VVVVVDVAAVVVNVVAGAILVAEDHKGKASLPIKTRANGASPDIKG
jgi:hypothetical protein